MTALGTGGANAAPRATNSEAPDSAPARSWSQYNTFRNCSFAWLLEKKYRVPGRPGVWFPAGTAFHRTVERYLREKAASGM